LEENSFCQQKLFLPRQFFHGKTFFSTQWQKLAKPVLMFTTAADYNNFQSELAQTNINAP